ncbi:YqgE/AlgH family protein [Rhodovulum sp.]|uniref:YqgE/AlgH family protein n=1 Tax=Rhodovulum sp. TaxID=34009 RepID=UPI0017E62E5D|nr:YqgE/AlgH family protein [Rhodovulum sp.]HDR27463.1 YqgE/AlgH family protein [Rhodovulum sp.]
MQLSGKLLIAMPGMGDPRFERSVVFLCAHSEEGAMGLIVNKPMAELSFSDLLRQLGIARAPGARDIRVHFGGPVEHARGFVLHSGDYNSGSDTTLRVDGRFGMTATLDILEDIAKGQGPTDSLLALGYAGWGPGQLEGEIQDNGWLTCEAVPEIVFDPADAAKWERALRTLGIEPLMLSSAAGRA